ncbi:MAG: EamA family transporter [Pirellula sp.]
MTNPSKPSWLAIILALLTLYVVWGSTYLAIRVGVESIPPFLMGGMRFAIAGLIVLGFVAWRSLVTTGRGLRFQRKQLIDNAVGGFFMLLGGNGLVSWAEKTVPSGMATLVISLNPVFFVIAEWGIASWGQRRLDVSKHDPARGEQTASREQSAKIAAAKGAKPNAWTLIGLVVGFAGLAILVGPANWLSDDQAIGWGGLIALVMACVNWTIGSLYVRYASQPTEPFAGSGLQMVFGAAWMLIASALLGELREFQWTEVTSAAWWSLAYLVVAGSLIGYTSFVWLMKHTSPTLVSTYGYINPIVAVFLGWWILHEPVGPRMILASITILVGVAMISLAKPLASWMAIQRTRRAAAAAAASPAE